jgi:glycosyltransferase involved in cell wall biosynthesis
MSNNIPKLSVVIVFYNMRREALRTLYSLTRSYQRNINEEEYEVIVLDSNSSQPLTGKWVESHQANFSYHYISTDQPTPCRAMNAGISLARAENVVCMIDGARVLTPGILANMIRITGFTPNAFIQTLAFHLGPEQQNISMTKGYNQTEEDFLIDSTRWHQNGYELFDISCLAGSSIRGYLYPPAESNCFSAPKSLLQEIGGFDEQFSTIGGGLVNLDVRNRILERETIEPFMLLGEGTFHQFHGGVATNSPPEEKRVRYQIFSEEYERLRGKKFVVNSRNTTLIGALDERSRKYVLA